MMQHIQFIMRNLRHSCLTSLPYVYNIRRNKLLARIHSACACDKSIAFSFVRSCGRKRMIGQMRVEVTGAKSSQEKNEGVRDEQVLHF